MDDWFTIALVLLFIVFPLLEGLARRGRGRGPAPPTRRRRTPGAPEGAWEPERDATTSEGLLPADLWEEITALSRGGRPEARRRPEVSPRAEEDGSAAAGPAVPRREAPPEEGRFLPGEFSSREAEIGTEGDWSHDAAGEPVEVTEWAEGPGLAGLQSTVAPGEPVDVALPTDAEVGLEVREPGGALRAQGAAAQRAGLTGADRRERLRRAVLHREILGPPVALRPPGEGPEI